jgi:transcriptional regulator of heat shock response
MEFKNKIVYNTTKEMEELLNGESKYLSDLIVDITLQNLKTRKKEIPVLQIVTKDTDLIYDIVVDREDMIETLEINLDTMQDYEDYERCSLIVNALTYLKSKVKKS